MVSATLDASEAKGMDSKLLTELNAKTRSSPNSPRIFKFPLFNGRQAVESQRKSAYKNTARAAGEIIDNSFEAGASEYYVIDTS
jgi:hypothetical protein